MKTAFGIRAAGPIRITFAFFVVEDYYDYLYVRDGESRTSPSLGKFHGSKALSPVETSGNAAYLNFRSDDSTTKAGFKLTWELIDKLPSTTEPPTTQPPTTLPPTTQPPTTLPPTTQPPTTLPP